jgi:lysophospholipase L1-like esterase
LSTLKTWLTRAVLVGASLLTALVLVELALRLFPGLLPPGFGVEAARTQIVNENEFGFYEYDPVLGWKGAPGAEGTLVTTETEFGVRFNSAGLRGAEYDLTKPDGVTRVAVLGDSFAWGYGVEQDDNFAAVLEERLNEAGYPVEVLNFGLTGYGTDQDYLAYLELARAYDPDIVILAFYENDVLEVANYRMYGYPKPFFELDQNGELVLTNVPVPEPPDWLGTREFGPSALGGAGTLKNRVYSNVASIHLVRFVLGKWRLATQSKDAYSQNGDAWPRVQALIAALNEEVTTDGARLVVLLVPTQWEILRVQPWAFELDDLVTFLETEHPDVMVVDPRYALRHPDNGTPTEMYFEFNGSHWTAAGHALIADLLVDTLLDEGLVR